MCVCETVRLSLRAGVYAGPGCADPPSLVGNLRARPCPFCSPADRVACTFVFSCGRAGELRVRGTMTPSKKEEYRQEDVPSLYGE